MPNLHAACVALGGAGVLVRGPAGSGKSSLALLLASAWDGALVADDRVCCEPRGSRVVATPHPAIAGLVEVRGQGLLLARDLGIATLPESVLHLVVDLVEEMPRHPEPVADALILGLPLPRLVLDRAVRHAGLGPLLVRAALRRAA